MKKEMKDVKTKTILSAIVITKIGRIWRARIAEKGWA
jgi:hypothetical protein